MTHVELAQLIGEHDYDDSFTSFVIKTASANRLVIVTAIGNDVIKLQGSMKDEVDCFHGGNIYFEREGDGVEAYKKQSVNGNRKVLETIWEMHRLFLWKFRSKIPHSKFKINKNGRSFCEGIIFSLNDI